MRFTSRVKAIGAALELVGDLGWGGPVEFGNPAAAGNARVRRLND